MDLNHGFGMDFSVAGKFYRKINITFRVFGVIPSYLVCIELIGDVFIKNKNFDEKYFPDFLFSRFLNFQKSREKTSENIFRRKLYFF